MVSWKIDRNCSSKPHWYISFSDSCHCGSIEFDNFTHWAEINDPKTKEDFIPKTGDEIHFTDGTVWYCGEYQNYVVFFTRSFKELKDMGYFDNYLLAYEVKSVVIDAIKGGAKIVRGVGLVNPN